MTHTFGIIQPKYEEDIPGTCILADPTTSSHSGSVAVSHLKTFQGSDHAVVLVPQPSNDPNDPLNWGPVEKRAVLWTVAVASALVHTLGPVLGTSYMAVDKEFHQGIDRVVEAMSGNFALTAGIGTVLVSAFAVCYGKRPTIILSILTSIAISIWIVFEKSFRGITAARALQGLATAPLEVLGTALVSDIYFIHQRGSGLAVVGALHFALTLICQVAGGFVVQYLGWRKVFMIEAGIIAALLPAVFFLVPETTYDRVRRSSLQPRPRDDGNTGDVATPERKRPTSTGSSCYSEMELHQMTSDLSRHKTIVNQVTYEKTWTVPKKGTSRPRATATSQRSTYRERLRIWNGKLQDERYWAVCLRPFPLALYPAVLFGIFVHGLGSTWLLAFAFAKLKLFSAPPYHLTPSQIGLTVLPGAASGALAQAIAGYTSDYLVKRLSHNNKGIYEAEFRLLLMIPQTIFAVLGFIGFGMTISQGRPLWIVLACYSCVAFSVPFGSTASLTYLVDTIPRRNQEALVTTIAAKSIFVMVFASMINGQIDRYGARNVFITMGLLNLVISACTIPFYIYGKLLRAAITRSKTLRKLDRLGARSNDL